MTPLQPAWHEKPYVALFVYGVYVTLCNALPWMFLFVPPKNEAQVLFYSFIPSTIFLAWCGLMFFRDFRGVCLFHHGTLWSLFWGSLASLVIYVSFRVPFSLSAVVQTIPAWQFVARGIYYLVAIALLEEIVFRVCLGDALIRSIRNKGLALLLGGGIFYLGHCVFDMIIRGVAIYETINVWSMCLITAFHVVFQLFYRRHKSITGPVLVHFTWDFCAWIMGSL